jgi:hypothetical protein
VNEAQESSGSPFERDIEEGPKDELVSQQPPVTIEYREGDQVVPADSPHPEYVHLPAVISDEFGMSQPRAREQIELGVVEIGGVEVTERGKLDWEASELDGKEIVVIGRDRSFKLTYDHDRHVARSQSFR